MTLRLMELVDEINEIRTAFVERGISVDALDKMIDSINLFINLFTKAENNNQPLNYGLLIVLPSVLRILDTWVHQEGSLHFKTERAADFLAKYRKLKTAIDEAQTESQGALAELFTM